VPEPDSTSRRRRRALLALLFYGVATLLIAAPLPLHFATTVPRAVRQDVWLNVWALAWTSEHLLAAPATLFDANIFFPHASTLAYTDHFIGEALLAAPAYWLSGSAVVAYNVAWYAALVLTAWGGYLWVRALIGDEPAGEAAALVAGAFCLLVPGKRTAFSHLQVISLQGLTLALFALHLLLQRQRRRWALALAAATVYAAMCSWYTAAYAALALPAVGLVGLWAEVSRRARGRVLSMGVAALLLAGIALYPVALPFRAVQREFAFERPLDELVATSLAPIDLVSSWSWLHGGVLPEGSGAGGYFPGVLAVVLVALGLRDGRRRADRWPALYFAAAAAFALLSLGPRLAIGPDRVVPLPYELLYRFVPGFGALRNPYRAAFVASLLLAVPVGYGARALIEGARARLPVRQRRWGQPGLGRPAPVTWGLAVLLATVHLLEAWPGPQEVSALPEPPGAAYGWLAEQPDAAALVWPLPRPLDDNARYQLWTIGSWVPLVNGHSGLYPPDFTALYRAGAEFPDPRFVAYLKERFPVSHVLAHYGLVADGRRARTAAESNPALEEVWSEGGDVIYRVANGAPGGWLRRRLPRSMLLPALAVETAAGARGCSLRVLIDDVPAARVPLTDAAAGPSVVPISPRSPATGFVTLQLELLDGAGMPRLDLRAGGAPEDEALLDRNGVAAERAPVVVAVLDRGSGRLTFARGVAAEVTAAAEAVRDALGRARNGDEILLAVVEGADRGLIERLRLLLAGAGAAASPEPLAERGTAFAFRGRAGAAPGSAQEVFGEASAELLAGDRAGDCRLAPIHRFTFRNAY